MEEFSTEKFELHPERIVIEGNYDKAYSLFRALGRLSKMLIPDVLGIGMHVQDNVFQLGVTSKTQWTPVLSQIASRVMQTLKRLLETPVSEIRQEDVDITRTVQIMANEQQPLLNKSQSPGLETGGDPITQAPYTASSSDNFTSEVQNKESDNGSSDEDELAWSEFSALVVKAQRSARALGREKMILATGEQQTETKHFLTNIAPPPPPPEFDCGKDVQLEVMIKIIHKVPPMLLVDILKRNDEEIDTKANIGITGENATEAIEKLIKAHVLTIPLRQNSCRPDRNHPPWGRQ